MNRGATQPWRWCRISTTSSTPTRVNPTSIRCAGKSGPSSVPAVRATTSVPGATYHAQPGLKRYRCKEQGGKRTFNDLTGTLLDGSKRSVMHWILATFLLCLSCASRRIAKELGVHVRTGYRWCWWLRNAALSYEIGRKLEGTVEADDLYHTAGHKGQAKKGGTKSLGRTPRGRRKKREPFYGVFDPAERTGYVNDPTNIAGMSAMLDAIIAGRP